MDLNKNGKDDVKEIVDGVTDFISQEGVLIGTAVGNAFKWLQGELAGVPDAVQGKLTEVIQLAKGDGTRSLDQVVTAALNIAYDQGHSVFENVETDVVKGVQDIKSSVLEAVARITTVKP